jgi:hypothetical protein
VCHASSVFASMSAPIASLTKCGTARNGHKLKPKLSPPSPEIVACVQLWACVGRSCTHKRTSVTGK